jgi:hypothetical protein
MYYNSSSNQAKVCINSNWVAIGVPTVTSLPASPANGDEVYYQFNRGDGTNAYWHLKYNSTSTYWDYLGGPSMYTRSTANIIGISATAYTSFSPAVSLTTPLQGDYDANFGTAGSYNDSNNNSILGLVIDGSTPSYPTGDDTAFMGGAPSGVGAPIRGNKRIIGVGTNKIIEVKYAVSGGSTGQFRSPSLILTPIRVK